MWTVLTLSPRLLLHNLTNAPIPNSKFPWPFHILCSIIYISYFELKQTRKQFSHCHFATWQVFQLRISNLPWPLPCERSAADLDSFMGAHQFLCIHEESERYCDVYLIRCSVQCLVTSYCFLSVSISMLDRLQFLKIFLCSKFQICINLLCCTIHISRIGFFLIPAANDYTEV